MFGQVFIQAIKVLNVMFVLFLYSVKGSGSNQDLAGMSGVAGKITTQIKTRTTISGALLGVDRDLWSSEVF